MSQNLKINGVNYNGVGSLKIHTQSGGTAIFVDSAGGYIIPSGTKNIVSNGTHDVTSFASVLVDVPIPDGYISISDILTHTTQQKSGTYTGTGKTLENISIAVGFKPKIFILVNDDAIYSDSAASPYSLLSAAMIYNDNGNELISRSSFVLKGDFTKGYGRGGQSGGTCFKPTSNGVQGVGKNVKANRGMNYNWFAWG